MSGSHCHFSKTPLHIAKKELRARTLSAVRNLKTEDILTQSLVLSEKLFQSDAYKNSTYISVFLNMPKELSTKAIFHDILKPTSGKLCYSPKITPEGMKMMRIHSIEDYESLPLVNFKKFSIVEPSYDYNGVPREEAPQIDLFVVPGAAFDLKGGRLGYGKGYYDRFIRETRLSMESRCLSPPKTIALALREQLVDEVPMEEHDQRIDQVLTENSRG